ncbi:MAG TPA: hypothetical protein DER70_06680 [Lentisphaeria bacterium]|nr:hypothetical protein [Lentisphaeria bacterium]
MNNFLKAAEEWRDQCFAIAKEAITLAKAGKTRDSLEFDALKTKAKALGGNALAYLYQKFDQAVIEHNDEISAKENQNGPEESPKSKKFLLGEITRLSTWGKRGREQLNACMDAIRKFYPQALADAERRKARGERLVQYKTQAVHLNPEKLSELMSKMEKEGFTPYEISIIRKMKDKIELTKKIKKSAATSSAGSTKPENEPEFVVQTHEISFDHIHRNSIPELPATNEWTILFDETGTDFKETAFGSNVSGISLGRMIALLVPDYTELPPCKDYCHSVDLLLSEVHAMQQVLLAHKCGIIGIPVNALYRIHAEQWFSCIETLLDLILRLLPINGKTKLKIYVEQRGKATAKDDYLLQKTCDDCLFHLSRAFPERSQAFEIESHIIKKEDHPWNGYVDAVAFCWSSPNGKMILNESGWEGSCLIGSSPYFLRYCIDTMEHEDVISPDDWSELLKNASEQTNSLEKSLLKNLGMIAKQAPGVWKNYLDYTVMHLNSKAIDMTLLGKQVSWLSCNAPLESELPPRLRLMWLTAKLAEENHRGSVATHPAQREEFIRLSEDLFEEDAPLTCNAALNLAVSYTDEYDFESAQKILSSWRTRRPEVPGLQYYGRLLSSYGQHEAFLGRNADAIPFFRQAINTFGRLSDKGSAFLDVLQTSAYLLTSMMDCLPDLTDDFRREAEKYFGGKIVNVAPRLGVSTEDKTKYQHHILLRYLTGTASTPEERNAYLDSSEKWSVGAGHPWEMIEFYRALLVAAPDKKILHLQKAYDIAMTGEGTLHVIAAVILGSLVLLQPEREKQYLELVEQCAVEIPALGNRVNILREHVSRKYAPLELAALILPFNFR